MRMYLSEIAQSINAVGDFEQQGNILVTGVQTDSRLVKPGDIFVCLNGKRFDGHNFVKDSLQRGAVGIIAQRPVWDLPDNEAVLLVQDSLAALGTLAGAVRRKFKGEVIAVTGSAGKTTVKELLASILGQKGKCARNYKNWNNQLGVPLSIFSFTGKEDFWVLEAGISMPGDMDELGLILAPDMCVINNIGPAHLQGLGSIEGVAREKTSLIKYMSEPGKIVFSLDYPLLEKYIYEDKISEIIGFSCHDLSAPYSGIFQGPGIKAQGSYALNLDALSVTLDLPWKSSYMTENILAAATAARLLGVSKDNIQNGLLGANLPEHRCQISTVGSFNIIDDSYNANPLSMRYALENAAEHKPDTPLIAVLGDMYELGVQAETEHEKLGRVVARVGCKRLFYVGQHIDSVQKGLQAETVETELIPLKHPDELIKIWNDQGLESGTVLFKGSRACGLEDYVKRLTQEFDQ